MGSGRARRFAAAAIAAVVLATVCAVFVASAAPQRNTAQKGSAAPSARTMSYACASNLYNARNVLHFVARPSSCTGSGHKLVRWNPDYPVYTCRKEHGGFAGNGKQFQFPHGIYGHGPAGLMRWVSSLSQCAAKNQPNETAHTLPLTTRDQAFCAAKRGGELRWISNSSSCNGREFRVVLKKLTGFPVARGDSANTDEDHSTNVNVLANDTTTSSSHSNAGLHIASTDTAGTKGSVSVNPDRTIAYSPNGQFESLKAGQSATDSFKYRVKRGAKTSAPATVTVKIAGVNDLPVARNDSATTDSAHTTSIPVLANDTDADGDSLSVSVDTSGTQGNVTVNPDGTVTYDPNHKFDSLTPSESAHDTFKYTANDGHGNSNQATVDVTINGFDDPPVVTTSPGDLHYTEGDPPTVLDPGVTVSDPDSAKLQSGRIAISDGHNSNDVLHLPNPTGPGDPTPPAPGGITGFYDTNTGVLSLTAPAGGATKADWQAALRTVTFGSGSDNPFPTKKLDFTVNDGNSDSAVSTKTITTTRVNDPPQVQTSGGTSDFVEDSPPVAVDPAIDVSDPDSLQLQGATVAITGNFSSADGDTLNFTNQNGISGSYDSSTGVLTLTGTAAISDYQSALASITFNDPSNTPSTADRTVSIQVTDDAGLAGNTDTKTVTVTAHNDAPVNSLPAAQSTNEDNALTLTGASKLSLSDADAGSDPIKVTLSASHGTLTLGSTAGLTVTGDGTSSVSATGSQSALNTGIDGLKYTPDANYNGSDSIQMVSDDQGHNPAPAQSTTSNLAVTVNAVNDAPVNSVPGAQVTNEDTALVLTGASKPSVSDVDSDPDAIKVDLSASHGTLTLSGTSGLTVTGNGTGSVEATGTQSDINSALDGLTYTPAANYNGSDAITMVTDDQGHNGSGGAQTDTSNIAVTINAVNDAPVNSLPAPQSTNEDTALVLTGATKPSVSDADAGSDAIKVSLSVSHGTLTLSGTSGLTVTGDNSATVDITGSQSDINTALNGLTYTPAANYNGSDSLQMVSDDQGHNGAGGAQTDTASLALTVNAVNDAPVNSVPAPQSTNEDTPLTLSAVSAPSVNDVDAGSDPIKVTLSASHGTLTLSGTSGLTVTGNSTGSVEATGSQSDINTALDGVTYTPDANYNGSDTITMVSDDQGHNPAPAQTSTNTVSVTVNAVNDAPVNTAPSSGSTNEDTALVFSSANSNPISVSDPDAGSDDISVTLSVLHGTLTLGTTTGLTSASNDGTSNVVISGPQGAINTALDGLAYTPSANYNGSDTLNVLTDDNGHNGSGGAHSASTDVPLTIAAINDAPVNTVPSAQSVNEDNGLTFSSASSNQITVADVDAGETPPGNVKVELTVSNGTLTLASTAGLSVTGQGSNDVTATGTTGDINTALNGLLYQPDANYHGADSLGAATDDLGHTPSPAQTDSDSVAITVNSVNDPPVVDLDTTSGGTGSTTTFNEVTTHNNSVAVAPNADVTDVDNANIDHGSITLTNHPDGSAEKIAVDTTGTSITASPYDSSTGLISLTGVDTKAHYAQVIKSLSYSNTAAPPNAADRHIDVKVNDGTDDSATATATVQVVPIDLPPVVDLNGGSAGIDNTASFTEDSPAVAIAPSATVTDADSPNLVSTTVTLTNKPDGTLESLTADTTGTSITTTGYNSSTGVLSLTGTDTPAHYQQVIQSVKYNNTSNTPDTTQRDITVVANDGQQNSVTATSHVSVTAHNDAPSLDLNGAPAGTDTTASFTEDQPSPTTLAPNTIAADVDSPHLQSATIQLTNHPDGTAEALSVDTTGTNITSGGYNSSTGALTLTGDDTVANYQQVLRTIAYNNSSQNADATDRVVNFKVNDGTSDSNSPTSTVTIHVINDPPVVDMNGGSSGIDSTAAFTEDSAPANPGSGPVNLGSSATVSDVDNANLSGATLTLTNHPDGVSESLSVNVAGTSISTSGYNASSGVLTLTGSDTVAHYQQVIRSAQYNNVSNTPDPTNRDVTIKVNDGAADSTVAHTTVSVTPTDDAPVANADTFNSTNSAVGNTTLNVNDTATTGAGASDGRMATPDPTDTSAATDRPHKEITGNIFANDTDPDNASSGFTATPVTDQATNDGGTVTIQSDGDFNFEPAPSTSCTDHSDSFTYTLNDNNPGGNASSTGTVTVAISGCVWYVNNKDAQGSSGTSEKPFDTLADAETASGTGDTIFVYHGDGSTAGQTTGVDLKANQKLVGEADTLSIGSDTLQTGGGDTKRPTIKDTASNVVNLAAGNTVTGVQLDPEGGGGISGGSGATNGTIADVKIVDNGTAGTAPGLDLNGMGSGSTYNVSDLTVDNTGATTPPTTETGVRLLNAGTVNFASAGTISIKSKNSGALDAQKGTSGTTSFGSGSVFDDVEQSSGGATGILLNGTTGTVSIGNTSTSDISTTGASAIDVSGAAGVTMQLHDVSSSGAANGINFDNNGSSTFNAAGTSGSVSGTSNGVLVNAGLGDFTYAGSLGDGTGNSATITNRTGGANTFSGQINDGSDVGGGIVLSGNSAGSTTFSNSTKTLNTDTGNAVVASMPDGSTHSLVFSNGGLNIDTTSGKGFEVTGSGASPDGSVEVSGALNTIDTGSGKSLNITNANVSANGNKFEHISGNGAGTGILLNNTGSNDALTVASNGGGACDTSPTAANCTGGQIQNASGSDDSSATPVGTGVVLNNTKGVSLTRVWIHDNSNYGIRGNSVTGGFVFSHSVLNGTSGSDTATSAGTPFDEAAMRFTGLTGSNSITNSAVSGGVADNIDIANSSGSLNRLTIQSSNIGDNSPTHGNNAVGIEGTGTATMNVTADNNTFTGGAGEHFDLISGGTAGDLVFTNNTMSQSRPTSGPGAPATGSGDIRFVNDATANSTINVANNTMTGSTGAAILIAHENGNGSNGTGTLSGTVSSNQIGTAGTANSGSSEGDGIQLNHVGGPGSTSMAITNNQIHQYNDLGIELISGGSGLPGFTNGTATDSSHVDATVTGNTISSPGNNPNVSSPFQGIQLNTGTTPGQSFQWCANIKGNSIVNSGRNGGTDFRLRQRQSTTVRLPGYGGPTGTASPSVTDAVTAFMQNQNDAAPLDPAANAPVPSGAAITDAAGGGFVGGSACSSG